MKVLLLSRYGLLGASSRVRMYQYLPYLRDNGIEVTVAPLLGDEYLKNLYSGRGKQWKSILGYYLGRIACLINASTYDLLWIEKEVLPWAPAWGEILFERLDIPYVVDYDDAVFHNYDLNHKPIVWIFLGDKIDKVMRHASLVIVGNQYLADRARQAGAKRVEYLPTIIDLERYQRVPLVKNKKFTIGWIGSPNTAPYLKLIESALAQSCNSGDARVVVVGSGEIELAGVPLENLPWSEETEVAKIQGFDVGIMPLPDEPWARGKCGYKLIQYMACGRPVIASPVGVNKQIVQDGVNGFLASSTEEWVTALNSLSSNRQLVDRMGAEGRAMVEKKYCLQVTAPQLVSLLRSVK